MSFSGQFLYPHTISVEPWSAGNVAGGATYGSAVTIKGRVVKGSRLFRQADRQEVKSIAELFAPADDVQVGPKDRITVTVGPSIVGADGSAPPILGDPEIYEARDGSKVQHVVFG